MSLPGFESVFVAVTEDVAHGQNPAHITLKSLPARQACCSILHCKKKEREGGGRQFKY